MSYGRDRRTRYEKKPHHKKKEVSLEEENRRLWKQRKQRDKPWQGHHHCGPWDKWFAKKKERVLVRGLIHRELFDEVRSDHRKEVYGWGWY